MKNVWHKRWHGDALTGYMGLSLEQRGAYTTLLDLMYDSDWDEGIADRERFIAGHMNVSVRKWKTLRDELIAEGKIDVLPDGRLSNSRYRKERENALSLSRKRSESGASGGEKSGEARRKSSKINEGGEANASDLPLYTRAIEAEAESDKKEESSNSTTGLAGSANVVEAEFSREDILGTAERLCRAGGVALNPAYLTTFNREFDLVKHWLAQGIPESLMLDAIERQFNGTKERSIKTLRFYEARIASAFAETAGSPQQREEWTIDRQVEFFTKLHGYDDAQREACRAELIAKSKGKAK